MSKSTQSTKVLQEILAIQLDRVSGGRMQGEWDQPSRQNPDDVRFGESYRSILSSMGHDPKNPRGATQAELSYAKNASNFAVSGQGGDKLKPIRDYD